MKDNIHRKRGCIHYTVLVKGDNAIIHPEGGGGIRQANLGTDRHMKGIDDLLGPSHRGRNGLWIVLPSTRHLFSEQHRDLFKCREN
jgi:hypothetical protein